MTSTRIIDAGPLFTTLSERYWPEIGRTVQQDERIYKLDLANVSGERDLLKSLLACFEIPGYEAHTETNRDACLDDVRGTLPFRSECGVLLAVFNLGDYPLRELPAFLTLACLLTRLARDMSLHIPTPGRHRVRLAVVFFGMGLHYPAEPCWPE